MIYVVFDALGKEPTEEYLNDLERRICEVDGVSDITLACLNNWEDAVRELGPLDMNNHKNWGKLKIVMIPESGKIQGYMPRRLLEEFKSANAVGKSSYEVFKDIIGDEGVNA